VFNHRYGICAGGNASARHDLDALPRSYRTFKDASSAEFADAFEPRARRGCIGGTHSEPVTRGSIEWRIIAVRKDRLGQDAAKRLFNLDDFAMRRSPKGFGDFDYFLPRVSIGEHG
jgi:hypothetical protein